MIRRLSRVQAGLGVLGAKLLLAAANYQSVRRIRPR